MFGSASIDMLATNAPGLGEPVAIIENTEDRTCVIRFEGTASHRFELAPKATLIVKLAPGRYTYRVESPGIEPYDDEFFAVPDVRFAITVTIRWLHNDDAFFAGKGWKCAEVLGSKPPVFLCARTFDACESLRKMNKTFAATECAEHKVMYRIRHRGYGFYEPTLARCEEFRAAYIKELNAKSADATDITSCEERN